MSASQTATKVRVPRGRVAVEGAQRVWSSENGDKYHHLDCPMATKRAQEKPHLWTKTSRWDAVMDGKRTCFANCCHLHPMWDVLIIHEEVYVRTGKYTQTGIPNLFIGMSPPHEGNDTTDDKPVGPDKV